MWRYVVRRLLWVVLVVLIITAFTYVLFFVMPPTDPAVQFAGKNPTPDQIAEVRKQFGLDKPVWAQYGLFLRHLLAGDEYGWPGLGFSFVTRSPVRDQLLDRLPVTVQLAFGAALVWLCIGIPIGIVSAIKRRSLLDRATMLAALFFVSAPVFWLGLVALWLFWFQLGWSPGTGYVDIGTSFTGWLSHMILPWVVLALLFAAFYARMTRGNLIETMGQDYIRTARVKGLPERSTRCSRATCRPCWPSPSSLGGVEPDQVKKVHRIGLWGMLRDAHIPGGYDSGSPGPSPSWPPGPWSRSRRM
jgi:peptide/nickel transport system permease protein